MELLTPEQRESIRMVREQLCCILCDRVFEDPQCLDCKHNFCRECIFVHLRKRENYCPKCKLPTCPSEVTRNQFLQSMLVAWKAVEGELAGLHDPDAAVAALDQRDRERERTEAAQQQQLQRGLIGRGAAASSKWSVDTYELKQQALAAGRREQSWAHATLAQRAAAKNAVLATSTTSTTPSRRSTATATVDGSQTQMTQITQASPLPMPGASTSTSTTLSSLGGEGRARSQLFSPESGSVTALSSSSPSTFSPFSMLATQDVEGFRQRIQAQNQVLDEWERGHGNANGTTRPARPTAAATNGTSGRVIPTVSAVQMVQNLLQRGKSPALGTTIRTPMKRKRRIFGSDEEHGDDDNSDDEDYEDEETQTQMPSTAVDSPDLLALKHPQPAPRGRTQRVAATTAAKRIWTSGAVDPEDHHPDGDEHIDTDSSEHDSEQSEQRADRATRKRPPPSQPPIDIVDMTQDQDSDDEEVEDSQAPVVMPAVAIDQRPWKKRVSHDFQGAIAAFNANHRLAGAFTSSTPSTVARDNGHRGIVGRGGQQLGPTARTSTVTGSAVAPGSARPPIPSTGSLVDRRNSDRLAKAAFVFVGTDLNREESKEVLVACQQLGGRFGREFDLKRDPTTGGWTTSVTHLITKSNAIDPTGGLRCKRTAKYMRALAEGTFVVDFSWIQASLTAGAWLPEERFEVSGDCYSDSVGKPREGRLRRLRTGHRNEIFRTFRFVVLGPLEEFDFSLEAIQAIVLHFGARVCTQQTYDRRRRRRRGSADEVDDEDDNDEDDDAEQQVAQDGEGDGDGDGDNNGGRRTAMGIVSKSLPPETARAMWTQYRIPIVRVTWIFDSISHLEALPFDDYYPY